VVAGVNIHQRIAHERLLRMLPVRTVTLPDPPQEDFEDERASGKNVLQLAAEREHRILKFMRPRVRYRVTELVLISEISVTALHALLSRMVDRERLVRHGTRRQFTYSKR